MKLLSSTRRTGLSHYLQRLTLATLLPLLVFALAAGWLLARRERESFERSAQERVRALSSAVDAELRGAIQTLQALAQSDALRQGDFETFHAIALRVTREQPSWLTVNLALPGSAQQLINVVRPLGAELPLIAERASFDAVLATGRPAIGSLIFGPFTRKTDFAVRVPVVIDGELRYVLSAVIDPALIQNLLTEQRFPAGWVGVVTDRSHKVVARSLDPAATVGGLASPSLRDALAREREGFFHGLTLEGADVYTPFFTSALSGWSVAIGIPAQAVEEGGRWAMWRLIAGAAFALAVGFALAQWLGRRIARPIGLLAARANALAAGDKSALDKNDAALQSPVAEIANLVSAFEEAATAVHARAAAYSELERVNAERDELLARERQLRAEAEAANRGKDEFLAMLGHGLRNPLGAIGNAVHLARLAPGTEHATRAQEVIARQVTHLTRMVDDLLDAGRVASGKIVIARAPLDLSDLVRRSVAALQADGRAGRHHIDCELTPAWVDGDETRLEQVLSNLLTNALRYTPAGGHIVVRLTPEGDDVVLQVRDDGIGIPPELLPRLFNLFVQGKRGLERSQGGLGIGLTLVRRLVELHGGSVEAASSGEGLGSTFTVRLPRIGEPAAAGVPTPQAYRDAVRAHPRRVLVVEDHEDVRAMLCYALRLAGHEVHECSDGCSGIELARALRPDIALIDIGLPGVSGYVVASIRAEPAGSGVLLIAITGYGQPEDRARSLAAGFDLHATKPIDVAHLLELIGAWPGPRSVRETAPRAEGTAS